MQNISWYITSSNIIVAALQTNQQSQNELDGQPSSLLARMHDSNYKGTFSPIHLVFLELDIHQPHLDFKILDGKKQWSYPEDILSPAIK